MADIFDEIDYKTDIFDEISPDEMLPKPSVGRLAKKTAYAVRQGAGDILSGFAAGAENAQRRQNEFGLGLRESVRQINPAAVSKERVPAFNADKPIAAIKETAQSMQIPQELQQPTSSKAYNFLEDAVTGLAGSAPAMVATAVNPPAGIAMMYEQILGGGYNKRVAEGADPDRAYIASALDAAAQAPLEYAGTIFELGALKKMAGGKAINYLKTVFRTAAAEGLEEGLQAIPEKIADIYASNPDKSVRQLSKIAIDELTSSKFAKEAGYQAAAGTLGGALLGGVGGGIQSLRSPEIQTQEAPQIDKEQLLSAMVSGEITPEDAQQIKTQYPDLAPVVDSAISDFESGRPNVPNIATPQSEEELPQASARPNDEQLRIRNQEILDSINLDEESDIEQTRPQEGEAQRGDQLLEQVPQEREGSGINLSEVSVNDIQIKQSGDGYKLFTKDDVDIYPNRTFQSGSWALAQFERDKLSPPDVSTQGAEAGQVNRGETTVDTDTQLPDQPLATNAELIAQDFNNANPGNAMKYDGQFDRTAINKPPLYQFTPQEGPLKGRTLAVENPSVESIQSKMDEMTEQSASIVKNKIKPKKGSGPQTIRGRIKQAGGINFLNFKGELQNMPVEVKFLSSRRGVPIDLLERTLKDEGWLSADEDILDILTQGKTILKRGKAVSTGSEKKTATQRSEEAKLERESIYEPEAPPTGNYVTMKAGDLPEGKKLTIIEGNSRDGWDEYEVIESDPFSVKLKDGTTIELASTDNVQVRVEDVPKDISTAEQETIDVEESLFEPQQAQKPKRELRKRSQSDQEQNQLFGYNQTDMFGAKTEIGSIAKKLKDQTGSSQLATDIINHGIKLRQQGTDTLQKFRRAMRQKFSDVWDKIKSYMRSLWGVLNNQRGEIKLGKDESKSRIDKFLKQAQKPKPGATQKPKKKSAISEKFNVPENKETSESVLSGIFDSGNYTKDAAKKQIDNARTQFLDRLHPLEQLGRTPYLLHRMLGNTHMVVSTFLQHGNMSWKDQAITVKTKDKGFLPWIKKLGDDGRNLFYWMAVKRAEVLESEGRENWLTKPSRDAILDEIFEGMTDSQRAAKTKEFEKLNDEFQQWNKNVLSIAQESGLLNKEQIDSWTKDFYLPFYRIIEDENTRDEFLKGPSKSKKYISAQIRRLKGGEGELGDPLENIIRNWTHLIQESQRNFARYEAAKVSMEMGLATEVTKQELSNIIGAQTLKKWAVKKKGSDRAIRVFENKVDADQYASNRGNDFEVTERQQTSILFGSPSDFKIMSYQDNGNPVYIKVDDPALYEAMTELNVKMFNNSLMKVFSGAKRLLTAGATITPAFRIANLLRDTLHTAVVAKSFTPFIDSGIGLVKTWKQNEDYIALMASGGGFGQGWIESGDSGAMARSIEKIIKREGKGARGRILDTPRRLWEFWEKVGHASEMAARVQMYSNVKKKGGTHLEAAFEAKDLLDFHLTGAANSIRVFTSVIPFLNARLQGLDRLYRGAKSNPKAFVVKGAILSAASLMLWGLFKDDERYKELEDWEKWQYHHFWIGDTHFRIPKAFEVGAIFSSLFETAANVISDNEDWEFFRRFLSHTMTETFAMSPPAAIAPSIELYADKSFFTGRPIEGTGLKRLPPGERNKPWTPQILKDFGRATNISPLKIESFLRGHTAAFGSMFLTVADAMYRWGVDAPELPEKDIQDLPAVGRFVRGKTRSTKYSTRFYKFATEVEELSARVNMYKSLGDGEKIREIFKENKDKLKYVKFVRKVKKDLSYIRKQEKRVWYSSEMSPEEKKTELDKYRDKKNKIYKNAYDKIYQKK